MTTPLEAGANGDSAGGVGAVQSPAPASAAECRGAGPGVGPDDQRHLLDAFKSKLVGHPPTPVDLRRRPPGHWLNRPASRWRW
jgi:hypothetical protein